MATTKKTEEVSTEEPIHDEAYWNEEVECEFFKDGDKYNDDIYVNVNGKSWLIQRGVKVKIPRKALKVIEESMESDKVAAERREMFMRGSSF